MESEIKMSLKNRLKQLIGEEKPHAWATKVGIPASTFSRIWNNDGELSQKYLSLTSEKTGVSIDWLLTGEGPMMRDQGGSVSGVVTGTRGVVQIGSGQVSNPVINETEARYVGVFEGSMASDVSELLELLNNYGSPAIVAEFKRKLLKIKEITEG